MDCLQLKDLDGLDRDLSLLRTEIPIRGAFEAG